MYLSALLVVVPLLAVGDDPDAASAAIAKKLSAIPRLSEASLKPLITAPDDVRLRFLAKYDDIKLIDDNRVFLASTLLKKDANDDVKIAAIAWLGKSTTNRIAAKALGDVLTDKNVKIRGAALGAIGGFRDPTVGPRLSKLLHDESPEIRKGAIIGLGRLGDRKQVPAIIDAYKKHQTGEEGDVFFGEALASLGETEVSLKIAPLGMKSRDYETRRAAIRALECIPSMKVIPVIMDNLVLELRRTIALESKEPEWERIYVTMCAELQRRTGEELRPGRDRLGRLVGRSPRPVQRPGAGVRSGPRRALDGRLHEEGAVED